MRANKVRTNETERRRWGEMGERVDERQEMEEWVAVGGLCWTEWRRDYGGNISLSINVGGLVSSVSHFIPEGGTPGCVESQILFFQTCSRSWACWNLPVFTVGMKNLPQIQNLNNR